MATEEEIQAYEDVIQKARLQADAHGLARQQQDLAMQPEETSMIKEQLDLTQEITRIDYLLKGYSLEPNDETKELDWVPPTDKSLVIFSEYGIHLIRNTIHWYLTKNLLLSNYDEVTIRKKMWNFTIDLIDTIFMEYSKVFQQPTVKDCIEVLKDRVERRVEISSYAREVMGLNTDKEAVKKEKLKEMEGRIEEEIEKIRVQLVKDKLKRFPLIVRVIQDSVHSTYMRAWKGIERGTLRQHTHISETRGGGIQRLPIQGGLFPWSKK